LLERISEDMKRNALKHDAVRRYLATDEEASAARRGLLAITGFRNVNFERHLRMTKDPPAVPNECE
jgi:hypothetical protein